MKAYTEKLHQELLADLEELDNNFDPQNLVDTRIGIIIDVIKKIKEKLLNHVFDDSEDEILYFKQVLPHTLAIYFYYTEKIEWDRVIRLSSPELQYKFLDRIYSQIESLRQEHTLFREYYRDGETNMDHLYFLRNSPMNRERKYKALKTVDASTPPAYSEILAMFIAFTRLEHELKKSVSKYTSTDTSSFVNEGGVTWTGSKVSGSELVYALKHSGLINNGNVSLEKVKTCLENAFSVKLGNISQKYQEMQSRKKENQSVLDKLKDGLARASDDIDQEYNRKRRL